MSRSLADRLRRMIEAEGPIPVSVYMGLANAHYYATRDPLGAAGDFTTAPEISQMFGELIGLWLADLWHRAGSPASHYVELGPGRGTLAVDALRAMKAAGLAPEAHLVETSPALRAAQAERLAAATWHDAVTSLPDDRPLLIVANEFFDALPVRQLVHTADGWRERLVAHDGAAFVPLDRGSRVDGIVRDGQRGAPVGSVIEASPASAAIMAELAGRIVRQGGAMLVVDYGYLRSGVGDTLQAVSRHAPVDPWSDPGERDLTAHVDFEALGRVSTAAGAAVYGQALQGRWLEAMGLGMRADALARSAPHRAAEIAAARRRLAGAEEMGELFKVMGVTAPRWPVPGGFA